MYSRFPLFAFALSLILLVGCDSGSSDDDGGGNGGGGDVNGEQVFGVVLTSNGSSDFTVDYQFAYCDVGVSDSDCEAAVAGAGTATPFGTNPQLIIETPTDRNVDRIYLDYEVLAGTGQIEVVRGVVDEDDDFTVQSRFETFSVTAGDQASGVYMLN